jgi:mono/diheme cytochrome c family protein
MKTFLKVVGVLVLAIAAIAAAGVTWLALRKPAQRAPLAEKIEATPQRLARGEYLVHHAADCVGCHSERDDAFGFPIKEGRAAAGGFTWDAAVGFPGSITAPNLTPDPETGLGKWTDGEILRAMREGVRPDGTALFPIMPYPHLRNLSDEDAKSIVAYLRTLPPVKHPKPARSLNFPLNFIVKFMPKPLEGPVAGPDPHDSVARGKYLTQIGGCYECHTPHGEKGELDDARAFAGGWEMKGPWGRVITANITPHPTTWLGRATRDEFIARFKSFENFDPKTAPKPQPGRNTIMPWLAASGLTSDDLGAIYDYLKTVKPVENHVNSFPDAK